MLVILSSCYTTPAAGGSEYVAMSPPGGVKQELHHDATNSVVMISQAKIKINSTFNFLYRKHKRYMAKSMWTQLPAYLNVLY